MNRTGSNSAKVGLSERGCASETRSGASTTGVVNNVLAWFLGLVTFFAADWKPSCISLAHPPSGGFAGWDCVALNRRWAGA